MQVRTRAVLALLAAGALAAPLPLVLPARAGDAVDEKVEAFKEYLKTNPDSQGLRNQIAELGQSKDPKVADVLMPLLKNPKYDDDVKITVCQTVGKQGKKEVASALFFLADSKPWEEKPKLIAAALEGVGDADAVKNYKELMKWGKKYLDTNGDIAIACFRAASLNVSRETVDDLLKELVRADYVTNQDNAQKKAARGAAKPVLVELLKKLTGKNIDDVKVWNEWWSDAKKTWSPPVPGKEKPKEINASDTFTDDAYAFEIKKPNKAWSFRESAGGGPIVTLEALEEGARAAWCELYVQGTKNMKSKTPEACAKEIRESMEGKFRDIKPGADWEKKCTFGGKKGVEQIVFGQHKEFDAVHMHNVFTEEGEVMYYMISFHKSGKKASLESDIEEIIKSFRIKR
jgi:hypothetical protein